MTEQTKPGITLRLQAEAPSPRPPATIEGALDHLDLVASLLGHEGYRAVAQTIQRDLTTIRRYVTDQADAPGGPWRWDESVAWNAPDTITVPISRAGAEGELVMDATQAAVLVEMLADAVKGGAS